MSSNSLCYGPQTQIRSLTGPMRVQHLLNCSSFSSFLLWMQPCMRCSCSWGLGEPRLASCVIMLHSCRLTDVHLSRSHSHAYRCALREKEQSLAPLLSPPDYPSTPCWWDRNFPVFRQGWALLDSWGWMRGVATHAMNCFLFLLKGSSETCGDHRRGWRVAGVHPVWGDAAAVKNIHQWSSS